MPALHHTFGYSCRVNRRMVRCNKENTNKVTQIFSAFDKFNFSIRRKDTFKNKTLLLFKAVLTKRFTILYSFKDCIRGIPITKPFLCYNIRINIDRIFHPFMTKNF